MKKLIILLALVACSDSEQIQPQQKKAPKAAVVTMTLTEVTGSSVDASAVVESESPVKSRGFVISGTVYEVGNGSGAFSFKLNGLTPRGLYSIKAFAQNDAGMSYSEELSFLALCPSTLAGTFNYQTTAISATVPVTGCDNITGSVVLVEILEGVYTMSDISFGFYDCVWGDPVAYGISIEDTCGEIKLKGTDQYGLKYTWSIVSNDGTKVVIDWTNDYGDHGVTTLYAVWPI